MSRIANGFEFLEQLKKENGKQLQNYKDFSHYLDDKARNKGVPIHGQFELTPLCNFSCKMCYVHLDKDQLGEDAVLSVETWKNLIYQAWNAGMIHATLTGGECLAYPGFDELYLYLHDLGCKIIVLTNGFFLDERRICFFKEHMPTMIQVSLYGCNDDVYERVTGQRAFNTVVENVRKAMKAELPVCLSVTPNTFMGEDVLETVRVAKGIHPNCNINSAIFSPREETGRSTQRDDPEEDLYRRIYQMVRELDGKTTNEIDENALPPIGGPFHECTECGLRCSGGRSSFVMNWKGVLFPCNRLPMIHADALHEGFASAWTKINHDANNWPRVPECKECPYDRVCLNCAGNMLRFAAPGKQPIKLCERTKRFVSYGLWQIPECE